MTNKVYVANRGSGTVTVIDGANPYNTLSVPVGTQPSAISVDPTENQIYVANGDGSVSVLDGVNATVLVTLAGRCVAPGRHRECEVKQNLCG